MANDSDYQIGSGLTPQELELASWWVRHKLVLRKFGYALFVAACVVAWGFVIWNILDIYVITSPSDALIVQRISRDVLPTDTVSSFGPLSLQTGTVLSFSTTGNRQDFVSILSNPNKDWWAEFTYQFSAGSAQTAPRQGYILPSRQQYVSEIGWSGAPLLGAANVQITNLKWHRIVPQDVELDYQAFASRRLQMTADQITYKNDLKIDGQTIGQTAFVLHNPSSYGFTSVDLTVILYRADTPAAVTVINVQNIKPGESRPITINWFDNISNVSKTSVQANVNILDKNSFLSPSQF